jgi:hypothetical protein
MIRVKSISAPDLELFATVEHSESSYGLPVIITKDAKALRPKDVFMHAGRTVKLGILSIDESISWYDKVFWWDRLDRAGYTVKRIQKL